jgi:hypothetical protein
MLARAARGLQRTCPAARRSVAHLAPGGEWLEVDAAAPLLVDHVSLRMGLGSDALDQIGDVRRIAWQAPPPGPPGDTPAQAVLADVHWDGFMARARDALVLRCAAARSLSRTRASHARSAPRRTSCTTPRGPTRRACAACCCRCRHACWR